MGRSLVTLHIAQLPRLIARRRSSAILGMIIIAMLWIGVAVKYMERARTDQSEAARTNQNFAMIFEENVLRSLSEIDTAIHYLRRSVENRKETTDYATILQTTEIHSAIVLQFAIADSHGITRAATTGPQPTPPVDLSDREHIRVHMKSTEDHLFISKPVIGRVSGQWSVQITRRFNNRDGSFAGVIVASLDPLYFTQFYNKIDLGSAAAIAMIGSDGVVRSSGGSADGRFQLGQDLAGTSLFKHMKHGADATFQYVDAPDGQSLLMALRKVSDYPLWVSVGVHESDVMQPSLNSLEWNALAGVVFTLIILAAMEQILRSEARAKQKAEQLNLTLEHMNQGIMLVTRDRDIPIINKRCGELLELPPDFVERPLWFDAFSGFQTDNNAGPLRAPFAMIEPSAAPASTDQCVVFERTRPDGKVIEVHSTPLPDGGFVQTFTDVTKRSQAESTDRQACLRRSADRPAQSPSIPLHYRETERRWRNPDRWRGSG